MQRRHFLTTCAGTLASLPFASATQAAAIKPLEVIDCHTHFYDPKRPEGIPWPAPNSPLYRTVLPADLRQQPQYLPVTGTVVVEASPRLEDNQWLLDLAANDPFLVGIVGNLQPGTDRFAGHLRRFAQNPLFRGIRVSAKTLQSLLEQKTLQDFKRLADADLALDVLGGPETPPLIATLARQVPQLRIVMNHLANVSITADGPPADWILGLQAAAKQKHVYAKISGLVEGASRNGKQAPLDVEFYQPYLDVVWELFGDDRVIYGSNWPVCERGAPYADVQRIAFEYAQSRSDAALIKLAATNSRKAYHWLDRPRRIAE